MKNPFFFILYFIFLEAISVDADFNLMGLVIQFQLISDCKELIVMPCKWIRNTTPRGINPNSSFLGINNSNQLLVHNLIFALKHS